MQCSESLSQTEGLCYVAFLIGDILGRFTSFEETWALDTGQCRARGSGFTGRSPEIRGRCILKKIPPIDFIFLFLLKTDR